MDRTHIARFGVACLALGALAACGGDDGATSTTTAESTAAVAPAGSSPSSAPAEPTVAATAVPTPAPATVADDSTAPSEPPASAPDEVATECVDGEWQADLDDLVGQLAEQMSTSGLAVSGAEASGTQTLVVGREGVLGFSADMTFVLSVDSGGVAMTMTQTQAGTLGADWAWSAPTADGGTMSFANFDNSHYEVHTTMTMGGQVISSPAETPSTAASDVPMDVTCTGDTLTTRPQASPFTTRWTRTG